MKRAYCAFLGVLLLVSSTVFSFALDTVHVVRKGDTIYAISRRYHVPVDVLQSANNIEDPTQIPIGTRLLIPGVYQVQKGDTYYGISRRFNVDLAKLLQTNGRSEDTVLKVGEYLFVPGTELAADTETGPHFAETDTGKEEQSGENSERSSASVDKEGEQASQTYPTVAVTVKGGEGGAGFWPHPGKRQQMNGKFPGVMISGKRGDEVNSVSSGRVIYSGPHAAFGRVVFVQSPGGYIYVYGGNEELTVHVGDMVTAGMELGKLGPAPGEDASRLYFSVWKNNHFVRPDQAPRG